jgi:hypothetical protein
VLLSVGLSKGTGEAGGAIPGHAIAAHFKDVREIYLFDPNVGIFKSGSLDEFRRSLETLIGTVWTQDFKWILDGTFGYSLFRVRPEGETNSVERGVPYSKLPEYTAAESKAVGAIPERSGSSVGATVNIFPLIPQRAFLFRRRCSLAFISSFMSAAGRISKVLPYFSAGCCAMSCKA